MSALIADQHRLFCHGARCWDVALFHEGMQQLDAEDFAAACANLEASYKLVPRTGTLLNLGICHSQQGQSLRARGELSQARHLAERDGQRDRVAVAEDYLRTVEAQLAFIELAPLEPQAAAIDAQALHQV